MCLRGRGTPPPHRHCREVISDALRRLRGTLRRGDAPATCDCVGNRLESALDRRADEECAEDDRKPREEAEGELVRVAHLDAPRPVARHGRTSFPSSSRVFACLSSHQSQTHVAATTPRAMSAVFTARPPSSRRRGRPCAPPPPSRPSGQPPSRGRESSPAPCATSP